MNRLSKKRKEKYFYNRNDDLWDKEEYLAIVRACKEKLTYASLSVARSRAKKLTEMYGITHDPYKCKYCHKYHLTTNKYKYCFKKVIYGAFQQTNRKI